MSLYIKVAEDEGEVPIELPLEDDGALLMSTLLSQFPSTCGLRLYNPQTCTLRGVRLFEVEGRLYPYGNDLGNNVFYCVFSQGTKEKKVANTRKEEKQGTREEEIKANAEFEEKKENKITEEKEENKVEGEEQTIQKRKNKLESRGKEENEETEEKKEIVKINKNKEAEEKEEERILKKIEKRAREMEEKEERDRKKKERKEKERKDRERKEKERKERKERKIEKRVKKKERKEREIENRVKKKERKEKERKEREKKEREKSQNIENEVGNIDIYKRIFDEALKPPKWLKGLESPFKWCLDFEANTLDFYHIHEKLCDFVNQGAFYGFEKFSYLLALLFMKTIDKEEEKYFELESECDEVEDSWIIFTSDGARYSDGYELEELYCKCEETLLEMAANGGDLMYSRIGPALEHVLKASRAHLLFLNRNLVESIELAWNIQKVHELSQECQAGFEGLKAKVIMSMYQEDMVALPYLKKAMKLDPNFGYWPYLIGKAMRKTRKRFMIIEEVEYFEKAVALERNPKFLVFLAQSYQEIAHSGIQPKESQDSINTFLQQAVNLYSECWRLKNDSAAITRRIAVNLMKINQRLVNNTLAKEVMSKADEITPDSTLCIALGKYYHRYEKNDEKALEYFIKLHPGDGTPEVIRLNLIKDEYYDPYDDLQSLLKKEEDSMSISWRKTCCDILWYHLVLKRDLESSAEHFLSMWEKHFNFHEALNYRSFGLFVSRPINLIEVLVNEILLLKEENKSLPLEEQTFSFQFEDIFEKIQKKHKHLANIAPKPLIVENLKRDFEERLASERRSRYKPEQNRKSGSTYRMEEPGCWRSNRPSDSAQGNCYTVPHQPVDENHYVLGCDSADRSDVQIRQDFNVGNEKRRNRGYSTTDTRGCSESHSNWRVPANSDGNGNNSSETNETYDHKYRGKTIRQYSSCKNNRYDVTITDWRRETRPK